MSSFFEDDEDSEAEGIEKRTTILQNIRAENLLQEKRQAGTGDGMTLIPERDDASELVSEEQELQRLRESVRYQQYAAARKRKESVSPTPAKRLRIEDSENERDKAMLEVSEEQRECAILFEGDSDNFRNGFLENQIADELLSKQSERTKSAAHPSLGRRVKACETDIDPKIIDDSSDDDCDSDGSSESALLGPALPIASHGLENDPDVLTSLPIMNEAVLGESHSSYVSSITIDRAGNRLITGSIDSSIRFWDFNSMNRSLRSFRSVNPLDEAPIRNLQYSHSGGLLLCSGGTNSAVVLHRDGHVLSQTMKGDMYIVDMARTKGHTGAILSGRWKPVSGSAGKIFATTSVDSTVRLWDANRTSAVPMVSNPIVKQLRVTKLRNERGAKVTASALEWSADGKTYVIGCSDGKVKIVDPESYSVKPVDESDTFMSPGYDCTSVCIAPHGSTTPLIIVRSTDDFLRVFDRRNLKRPLKEIGDLANAVSETNACFIGETGEHFLTGTSASRKQGATRGSIRLFNSRNLQEVWKSETEESAGSVVYSMWHSSINQIIYGTADGKVRVLYNSTGSRKGVLNCLEKSDFRKAQGIVSVGVGEVYLPSELHHNRTSRLANSERSTAEATVLGGRRAASEAMKPRMSVARGLPKSRVSTTLAKHLAARDVTAEWSRDPREAILRYAEVAEKDPVFTGAYKTTQPKILLAEKTAEQEEDETRRVIYERARQQKLRAEKKSKS